MIDSDKPDYDFEEVSKLLHVAEKTRDYPKLKRIHDAAMAQLEEHAKIGEPDPTHVEEPAVDAPHYKGEIVDHTEESEPALKRKF